jgi:hypothetical protein
MKDQRDQWIRYRDPAPRDTAPSTTTPPTTPAYYPRRIWTHRISGGSKPPTSHIIPGYPTQTEPPFVLPAAFLSDVVTEVRRELASQTFRTTNDQYSRVTEGYTEMKREVQVVFSGDGPTSDWAGRPARS